MLWTVGARFHFDATEWPLNHLEFWYRGASAIYAEERDEIDRVKKEAGLGR